MQYEQFAFWPEHSTTLQLIKLLDYLKLLSNYLCVNANNKIITVQVLRLTKILQDFLKTTTFKIRIDDIISNSRNIIAGVPHGCCLSPLLYLIYTNDLPINTNDFLALFADNTYLLPKNRNTAFPTWPTTPSTSMPTNQNDCAAVVAYLPVTTPIRASR